MEIPRLVEKLGGSWVIKLDRVTRKQLKITEVGQSVLLKRETDEPTDSGEEVTSYE